MKVVALISGGKDSCYNMMQCVAHGHDIVALANLKPSNLDELDSYMYQTVGHQAIELYSIAMGLPLFRRTIQGDAVEQGKDYIYNAKDEVEDLYELLKDVTSQIEVDGVAVGAVLSDYQRVRVENVCSRLGLSCFAYLWRRDQKELLSEMIRCHVEAIVIKVAAIGLEPKKHLGKTISEMYSHLCQLNDKFDCHVCGEGGEYETFTLDCPLFLKRIVVDSSEIVIHSDDAFAPVGYVKFKDMHLEDKNEPQKEHLLKDLPIFRGDMTMLDATETNICLDKIDAENTSRRKIPNIFYRKTVTQLYKEAKNVVMVKKSDGFAWISGIQVSCSSAPVEDETDQAMKELEKILYEIGTNLQHVILVHIYMKRMLHYAAVNSVYIKYFNLNPPSRVCVEANFLDSTVFQLDCLVVIPEANKEKKIPLLKREAMHVQSISHWAPANIGPYSQIVKVNGMTGFVAGCIGLWPSSMTVIDGGIDEQAPLALRHVVRILEAFMPGTTLSHVMSGVCYVTDAQYILRARGVWRSSYKKLAGKDCDQDDVILYVVIPALPKAAKVEWHVVSHRCSNQWEYINEQAVDNCQGFSVYLTNVSCSHHRCGSLNANIDVHSSLPRNHDISIVDVIEYFLETLDTFITSHGLHWDIMLVFRVFFRSDVFKDSYMQLRKVLRDQLEKKTNGKCPALVFVPVSRLIRTTQMISIKCWFQTQCSRDHDD